MGCQVSADLTHKQLNEVLDEEQILLVRTTWNVLAEDMEGTGIIILQRLIDSERMMRPVFLGLSTQPGVPPTKARMIDKSKLRQHALVVMEALGAAVESLDDSEYLSGVLYALGQTHANYHVTPEMLPKLWPAISYGLELRLQGSYTSEVKAAWKCVFNFLISKMIIGMEDYLEAVRQREEIAKENQRDKGKA